MRSLIKDTLLTIALLAVFLAAGYEFYRDLNREISNDGGEIIGEITYIENDAQRKFAGRSLWGELETSSPVYNYDSLRTIENSQAKIKLIDGTEITLAANTYIVLEWGEESQNIEFLGGNISAEGSGEDSKLQIKAEETVIALNQASLTLDKSSDEGLNLSVDEGSIGVTVDGETTNIDENFRASILDGIHLEQDAVKLISPVNNRLIVTTSASIPLKLEWEQFLPLNQIKVQISEYKDFFNPTEYEISPGVQSLEMDTVSGTFYWRISGFHSDGTLYNSAGNRAVVIRDNAPGLQVPEAEEVFEYRLTAPELAFSWEASALGNSSRLQIAETAAFSELIYDINGPNNFQTINDLLEGSYYWRVLPEYNAADLIAYSEPEVRRFRIEKNESLEAPLLILPAHNEGINPLKVGDGLRFSWKADREVANYRLLLSQSSDMSSPFIDQWSKRNSYLMEELPPQGEYFWRVEGLDTDNRGIPPSEIRRFVVQEAVVSIIPQKPASQEIRIVDNFDSINFSWESSIDGPYRVDLYRNGGGGIPFSSRESNGSSLTMVLPGAGEYIWQASVLDEFGDTIISSEQIEFTMVKQLEYPRILSPEEGESRSLLGSAKLRFDWLPVPGASYYSAELVPENALYPTLNHEKLRAPNWEIQGKDLLRQGGYSLMVQAHADINPEQTNSSDVSIRNFNLEKILNYKAPVLTYPADGQQISKLTIIERTPFFRWSQSPPLASQRFRLSKDPNFRSLVLDDEIRELRRRIPELETGRYYIQIQSEDNDGNKAPDSKVYSFSITDIPGLAELAMRSPLPGSIVNMQNEDVLKFIWNAVPRSDYYNIAFYRLRDNKKIFSKEKWKGTQYTFNELKALDVGSFRFEIQAIKEKDGSILQESPLLEVPIELSLPEITDVPDIVSPELQYAH